MRKIVALALVILTGGMGVFASGGREATPAAAGAMTTPAAPAIAAPKVSQILGSGASFPAPIYTKMFDEYNKVTGIKVNYQSIGSSGGRKNIQDKVVDFGASDSFVPDKDMAAFGAPMVHIPTVLGSIVVTYNLPGKPALKLTGPVVADIFLGKIAKWNDKAIADLNAGMTLPNLDILVAYRSDGSGTTDNFTMYLKAISPDWASKVGSGSSVNWPAGQGGAQNPGVAAIVQSTPGAIGYVEIAYAMQNKLPFATMQNKAGNWIVPSISTTSMAGAGSMPADTRIVLVNSDAPQGFPIVAMTWLLAYKEQKYRDRTFDQAKALVDLLWWVTHDGQKLAQPLDYAPLPDSAVKASEAIIKSMTYDGKPILK
jgi:phosphate transport system substrate-binding protein